MHARTTQNEMFSWLGSCESKDILRVPPFYKGYTLKKCSFSSTSILTSSCGINDEEKSRRNHGERRIHKGSLEHILYIESSGCPFGAASILSRQHDATPSRAARGRMQTGAEEVLKTLLQRLPKSQIRKMKRQKRQLNES